MSDEQQPTLAVSEGRAQAPDPVRPGERSWLTTGLTLVLRLLLLGVGVPLAWFVGVGVAHLIPASSNRPPLQEVALRRTNRMMTEVKRLPERWQTSPVLETRLEPVPIPTEPIEPLTAPLTQLSAGEKQAIREDLDTIEADLRTLSARLVDLETKLGQAQSTASVESRLAALTASLESSAASSPLVASGANSTSTATLESPPPVDPAASLPAATAHDSLFEVSELKVTLPSDALFAPGEARLLETAPLILSTILEDLNRYPEATILIGSYTDDRLDVPLSRELAFKQANALHAALAPALTGQQRWVVIGYGRSQAITDNQSPEARQRNRRIEISVNRR